MPASPQRLCAFIDASPSPFHVCATAAQRLRDAGYTELAEADPWPGTGKFFTVRAGSLVAWRTDTSAPDAPFRVVGGHTDSPNLRVKQHHDRVVAGWQVVALQPYGGAWLNSWLDRDLGISGRLSVRDGSARGGVAHLLVRIDDPILRVPQLAIHLSEDRKGVSPDPQRHVNAVWGLGERSRSFIGFVAERAGVTEDDVLGFDLMTHDLTPSAITGAEGEFVSAPRLDNQATCYAGLEAFLTADSDTHVPVLALFDHEEVGSTSDHGAQSELLPTVLERIVLAAGGDREAFLRRAAGSMVASGDMAHATHPNYPDRHEPGHQIEVNAGPVLKVHPNLRYATDGRTAAAFALACDQAGVPLQRYEHRADLPCGSTIGPMTSARTGIPTVDVGAAQLAMHSAREFMGAHDVAAYSAALQGFLSPA
ncbi:MULTISPECIES: M18 family aminopeptidase [unclassified Mycolicibacterium]|uniref:M18 family aminopeptidase n=1 Tax=unclassified Mycolicibacterium TaxID=2636767 RepID=UPI0012DCA594|nr:MULTISPECIES: M18 family aminopeptidase [unclassified Mycolicibacterium]MUL83852.1 M18 family aminopeptidase [Mycolicibacterium sp. CBMA 329]MUL90082.1 M18 family aminopeptidase [Mycolicibacterium sp. CBMA 331]MUL97898.1 M18 family aminopeptidase [Mycolicibacterium sp. CBMA 334]MUM29892.1 M18 family aminopeptidase [Mycolicibacterium sp. CBMA 295]MUM39597.1 M18 family aminopeptidase [Mycolicibacterium sp. CBMA 247]